MGKGNGQGGVGATDDYNSPLGHPEKGWKPSQTNLDIGLALVRGRGAGLRELESQRLRGNTESSDSKEKR